MSGIVGHVPRDVNGITNQLWGRGHGDVVSPKSNFGGTRPLPCPY